MAIKRITVRVPRELHEQVSDVAARHRVSLNRFVVEALEAHVRDRDNETGQWPLRELSSLLAPAAEAGELTEEELVRHVREVRRRIWKERYEAAARAARSEET